MPVRVVRTAADEEAWERAKKIARENYPEVTGDRFYQIVMGIYKKMVHYESKTGPRISSGYPR